LIEFCERKEVEEEEEEEEEKFFPFFLVSTKNKREGKCQK